MTWRDLSDSELRVKLEQRGVFPATAEQMAKNRDYDTVDEMISEALRESL